MSKATGKPRGRPKGAKSRRTVEREQQLAVTAAKAEEALGPGAFDGDAHALLVLTYKDTLLSIDTRLDAAKAAIPYEKPKLAAVELTGANGNPIEIDQSITVEFVKAKPDDEGSDT